MSGFQAVQCFQCLMFQVCAARRDRTFSCKVCGARQSVRRVHAAAAAARQVRAFVQARNAARGAAEDAYAEAPPRRAEARPARPPHPVVSDRWARFVDPARSSGEESGGDGAAGGADGAGGDQFVTALPDQTRERGRRRTLRGEGAETQDGAPRGRKRRRRADGGGGGGGGESDSGGEGGGGGEAGGRGDGGGGRVGRGDGGGGRGWGGAAAAAERGDMRGLEAPAWPRRPAAGGRGDRGRGGRGGHGGRGGRGGGEEDVDGFTLGAADDGVAVEDEVMY